MQDKQIALIIVTDTWIFVQRFVGRGHDLVNRLLLV